jgi:transcriptional regulator with XRE-family HTH domain
MSTHTYRVRSGADLGRVLRDARTERGLSQQDVVEEFGLSFDRTRLARIEHGEGFQSLDRALSVLRRLGVDVVATIPTEPIIPTEPTEQDTV